jgi:plasmid stabilization system protein ParE
MKVEYHKLAIEEIDDAVDYLLTHRNEEAVRRFLDEAERAERLIAEFPNASPKIGRLLRRCLFRRFPYQLVYRVEGPVIRIYAVAHLSRKPRYWRDRLK